MREEGENSLIFVTTCYTEPLLLIVHYTTVVSW